MTEENRAPPRHQCHPGCRMSADRALARHVGVAAFIVNNNPETMERGRRLFPTAGGCPSQTPPRTMRTDGRMLDRGALQDRSPSSTIHDVKEPVGGAARANPSHPPASNRLDDASMRGWRIS